MANTRLGSSDDDPSNLVRELHKSILRAVPATALPASLPRVAVLTLRLVNEPELAALIPNPIFANRLLSEPVFFNKSGGAGGTVAKPAAFLCNC